MVSQREKKDMKQFIVDRIEDSEKYQIQKADNSHIFLMQRPDIFENPREIHVVLHNKKMTINDYRNLIYENNSQGIATTDIFYKDSKNFWVTLGSKGKLKTDYPELKLYSEEDIKGMLHLRDLEKEVFNGQEYNEALGYYQPETSMYPKCIRTFTLRDVILDYTHLKKGEFGYNFPKHRVSIDFKIPKELNENFITSEPIDFKEVNFYYKKNLIIPYNKD